MIVAGATGSGKTVFVSRLIRNFNGVTTFADSSLRVLYFYGQIQPDFELTANTVICWRQVQSLEDFDLTLVQKLQANLVVVDDLMTLLGSSRQLSDMFTKASHHMNVSVVFILQNLFHRGSEIRNLSLNSHYVVVSKPA